MKYALVAFAALVVLIAGSLVGRHYRKTPGSVAAEQTRGDNRLLEFEYVDRSLIILVDGADVYCGNERAPKEAVEEYVYQTMKLNHVERFAISASDTTRYGDVIGLIDKLKKRGLKMSTVMTISIPTGTRLDLCGSGEWVPAW